MTQNDFANVAKLKTLHWELLWVYPAVLDEGDIQRKKKSGTMCKMEEFVTKQWMTDTGRSWNWVLSEVSIRNQPCWHHHFSQMRMIMDPCNTLEYMCATLDTNYVMIASTTGKKHRSQREGLKTGQSQIWYGVDVWKAMHLRPGVSEQPEKHIQL